MKIETLFVKYIKLRNKLNNGKIYKIVDNTNNNVYIGSTCCSLKTRLTVHKSDYKRFLNGLFHNVTSFEIIKNNNYKIELLEDCNIKTKQELLARERFFIKNNECLNKYIPGSCDKGIQQYKKQWYIDNKDKLNNIHKAYNAKNKDKANEKFVCQCGGRYTRCGKSIHNKSNKHINFYNL